MTDSNYAASGESRLKTRRNRLWRFCAIGVAIAAAIGFSTGYVSEMYEADMVPGWLLVAAWALGVVCFIWFSWGYYRRVDELDLLDNLWCCLVGLNFYIVALPSWWLFHDIGLAPQIDHFVIYFATMIIAFAAYGLRKLGVR